MEVILNMEKKVRIKFNIITLMLVMRQSLGWSCRVFSLSIHVYVFQIYRHHPDFSAHYAIFNFTECVENLELKLDNADLCRISQILH